MSARRGHSGLLTVRFNFVTDTRWLARLWIDQLHVRNINKSFLIDDAATSVTLRICPLVALDHRHALDLNFSLRGHHLQYSSPLAPVTAGDHNNLIVFLDFHAFCSGHDSQITSGASETIFIKFLSRSSRATGPNTRVPIGVPSSLIRTAAF